MINKRILLLINVVVLSSIFALVALLQFKPDEVKRIGKKLEYTSKQENQKCLKCHGNQKYELTNPEDSTQTVFKKMYAENIIDTIGYYHSNHYDFKCTDCHSADYSIAPHKASLKFEEVTGCIDCHGGDETYAKFHFDSIDSECNKSIHETKLGKDFNCYSCHNSHTYKTYYKDSLKSIHQVVEYSNSMCLDCHTSEAKMQYFGVAKTDMEKAHQWLPNQEVHQKNVRCIECHVQSDPSADVAHNVMKKSKAVKNCEDCHSQKSTTLNSLYLTRKSKEAEELGLKNPSLNNYVSVIRANKNSYLDLIAISLIALTLLSLTVHIIFRIKLKK